MIIAPTRNLPNFQTGKLDGRLFLTISAQTPEGRVPVSWFRGSDVGVGGRFCSTAPGEPVRRATLREMRQMARKRIANMRAEHPGCEIVVHRSRH